MELDRTKFQLGTGVSLLSKTGVKTNMLVINRNEDKIALSCLLLSHKPDRKILIIDFNALPDWLESITPHGDPNFPVAVTATNSTTSAPTESAGSSSSSAQPEAISSSSQLIIPKVVPENIRNSLAPGKFLMFMSSVFAHTSIVWGEALKTGLVFAYTNVNNRIVSSFVVVSVEKNGVLVRDINSSVEDPTSLFFVFYIHLRYAMIFNQEDHLRQRRDQISNIFSLDVGDEFIFKSTGITKKIISTSTKLFDPYRRTVRFEGCNADFKVTSLKGNVKRVPIVRPTSQMKMDVGNSYSRLFFTRDAAGVFGFKIKDNVIKNELIEWVTGTKRLTRDETPVTSQPI